MTDKPVRIPIAGPYRSGTGVDPQAVAADPVHHDAAETPRRAPRKTA